MDKLSEVDIGDIDVHIAPNAAESFSDFRDTVNTAQVSNMAYIAGLTAHCVNGNTLEYNIANFFVESGENFTSKAAKNRFKSEYDALTLLDKKEFKQDLNQLIQRLQLFVLAYNNKALPAERAAVLAIASHSSSEDVYSLGAKVFVVASEGDIKKHKEGLVALGKLIDVMENGVARISKGLLKALNVFSAVLQETYTLGNIWLDVSIGDNRMNGDYDYEKASRALGRRADATGDVTQIEQIVNAVVTSGIKDTSS